MDIFTRPPQLTTAVTDLIISIFAGYFIITIKSIHEPKKKRRVVWEAFMWTLVASGIGGFCIHGFKISDRAVDVSWFLLLFVMFLNVSMYAVIVFYELLGDEWLKKIIILMGTINMLAYVLELIAAVFSGKLGDIFVIYTGIVMVASIAVMTFYSIKKRMYFLWYITIGAALQIAGGIIQSHRTASFTLIWEFDFNSIYHFATMISIICFLMAYKAGYKHRSEGYGCEAYQVITRDNQTLGQ